MLPQTGQQLLILVLFILPGVVYQAVRTYVRGPVPEERDLGNRILRALAVSVVLAALYSLALGPELVDLAEDDRGVLSLTGFLDHPRETGALGLLLLVLIPAAVAYADVAVARSRRAARYDVAPTAWDHLFGRRGSCFVRARTKSGGWVGGWYGTDSSASAYPQPSDLYVQAQYEMRPDGSFGKRLTNTAGFYVKSDDIDVLEFLEAPRDEASD